MSIVKCQRMDESEDGASGEAESLQRCACPRLLDGSRCGQTCTPFSVHLSLSTLKRLRFGAWRGRGPRTGCGDEHPCWENRGSSNPATRKRKRFAKNPMVPNMDNTARSQGATGKKYYYNVHLRLTKTGQRAMGETPNLTCPVEGDWRAEKPVRCTSNYTRGHAHFTNRAGSLAKINTSSLPKRVVARNEHEEPAEATCMPPAEGAAHVWHLSRQLNLGLSPQRTDWLLNLPPSKKKKSQKSQKAKKKKKYIAIECDGDPDRNDAPKFDESIRQDGRSHHQRDPATPARRDPADVAAPPASLSRASPNAQETAVGP